MNGIYFWNFYYYYFILFIHSIFRLKIQAQHPVENKTREQKKRKIEESKSERNIRIDYSNHLKFCCAEIQRKSNVNFSNATGIDKLLKQIQLHCNFPIAASNLSG